MDKAEPATEGKFSPYENPEFFYDPFYPDIQYVNEVNRLRLAISLLKISSGNRLLDVACGTGRHLSFLQSDFQCTGVDSSEQMLGEAARRIPHVNLARQDMRALDLGRTFDVLTCLGGGVAYTDSDEELSAVVKSFYAHVRPGGVVLIDPWSTIEAFKDGEEKMKWWDGDRQDNPRLKGHKVARLNVVHRVGDYSVTDYHYLVAARGDAVRHLCESHRLRLFSRITIANALEGAGFRPGYVPSDTDGGELFTGVRPL